MLLGPAVRKINAMTTTEPPEPFDIPI